MAPVDGRNEVLDSEDEPMTSSPVAVSDGTVDKLFAIAQVPPQDTQDALREAARPHQATTWTVANVTAQRTDGLDADQSIASIDIDASMDEGADIKPTTTATSSKPMGSNNATNDLLPDVATRTTSETGDTRPQQHATMAHFTQDKEHVPASAKTAGAETMTAPTVQQTSEAAGDAVRDEVTTPEQQPETVDNKVAPECANEQSSHRSSNESKNIVEPEEESVPQHVEADLPQYDLNEDGEVSKLHSNEQSALREEANTLVTSQHDTPLLPVPLPSTDRTTSIKSKDAQHVDETTRPMQQDVIQRLRREVSSSGFDTKHRIISEDVHDHTNDVAAGFLTGPQGQSKGIGGGKETQQDASMPPTFSSGADVESHGGTITTNDDSKRDEAEQSSTSMNTEPQDSAAASVSCGLDSKATSFDTHMDIDISPSNSKVENHTLIKEATASPSLSTPQSTDIPTAHNSAEQTSQDPSDNHLEMSDLPASTNVCETTKAIPGDNTPTSKLTPNQKTSAQPERPQACPTPTPARSPQEITLAELKAQKSAMLASLAALPAIQVLMEENASADIEMTEADEEPTEADIMTAANKIVKDHIKLLHEYNELKDVGQGLMGLIADQRGVRIIEVQEEFGIEAQD